MQAASVEGRSAVSGGRRARRFQVHRGRTYALPPPCATWGGYTLHGGIAVGGRDAGDRERLCRYLARPALARNRLEETSAGLIRVIFKRLWADGTAGVPFTPLELVERLAALVLPPRARIVQTHGVLPGRSAWRREVVPTPPASDPTHRAPLSNNSTPRVARYLSWTAWTPRPPEPRLTASLVPLEPQHNAVGPVTCDLGWARARFGGA